jgi:dTDP-D-glucose 4,6-dehydratase
VHGDGTSHRSFLYVEDVAEAFDVVLHKVGSLSQRQAWVCEQQTHLTVLGAENHS